MKKLLFILIALSTLYSVAQTSGKYTINNVDTNTEFSDYGASFAKNKQILYSATKKRSVMSYIIKNVGDEERKYYELYVADMDIDGNLLNKKRFSDEKNTKFHNSDVVFTNDNSTVYFTRNNYVDSKLNKETETNIGHLALFKADVAEDGEWKNITSLPFNSPDYSNGHPALSNDNKKLYFVSDMPGTAGKTDLYVVDIKGGNSYSTPQNIKSLNTSGREMFPFIDSKNVLYFSSDGRNGMGGLDIYASKMDKGSFSEPVQLTAPLNSEADDFSFIMDNDKKSGYFSSNREGGKGDDDIYSFVEDEPVKFECKQDLIAKVFDSETKKPIAGATLYIFHDGKMLDEVKLDDTATYKMNVECKDNYSFKVKMDKYKDAEYNVETPGKHMYTNSANIAMDLIPIPPAVVIKEVPTIYLGPVYFNFDKYNIRDSSDADVELDRIISIMNQYPDMIVSIESHTDSRGDATYNEYLSLNRAKETKAYMVKHGISEDRIVGVKGLGESQLTNHCDNTVKCTEEEHQMNRRTMFAIINPDSYKKANK